MAPNGIEWGEEDWKAVESFFESFGPRLEAFAARHGLTVEKYEHNAPSWSLLFRHPRGGVGKVDVERVSGDSARLTATWWIDSYRDGVRRIKMEAGRDRPASEAVQDDVLTGALRGILGWREQDLVTYGGYKKLWQGQWSEEEFERFSSEFPAPKL